MRERNVLGYCCGSEFNAGVVFREFIAGVVLEWVDCECCCGVGFWGVVVEWVDCECCGVSLMLALFCSELFWGVLVEWVFGALLLALMLSLSPIS